MTANNTNSAASDNSVSQPRDDGSDAPANDAALAQIIEHTSETAGTSTRRDLKIKTKWSSSELERFLERLAATGFVELIGETDRQAVVLTSRGESFARRQR